MLTVLKSQQNLIFCLCLLLFFSCTIHSNTIDDVDQSDSDYSTDNFDQDISEELAALDPGHKNIVLTYGAKAFTFATGSEEMNSYLDEGIMISWFGYYYFKSEEADNFKDESLRDFVGRGLLEILDSNQRQQIYNSLAPFKFGLELIVAKRNELLNTLNQSNDGSAIDEDTIKMVSKEIGDLEGQIADELATACGEVIQSLESTQLDELTLLRQNSFEYSATEEIDIEISNLESDVRGSLNQVASRCFTFASGSAEQNVFLDPGRIANYFGYAYYKNLPTPGTAEFEPPKIRSDLGTIFLMTLSKEQRQLIYDLPIYLSNTYEDYLQNRTSIVAELDLHKTSTVGDSTKTDTLIRESGRLDGLMTIEEAKVYNQVINTLSTSQQNYLSNIRNGTIQSPKL